MPQSASQLSFLTQDHILKITYFVSSQRFFSQFIFPCDHSRVNTLRYVRDYHRLMNLQRKEDSTNTEMTFARSFLRLITDDHKIVAALSGMSDAKRKSLADE